MPQFWQNLLVGVVVAILTAIVSAVVTVVLAFRRFRAERWWDRRASAYGVIIEALHVMKQGIERNLRSFEGHRPPQDDERHKELIRKYRQASDEVHKAVDTSSFLLSAETVAALGELMSEFQKAREDAGIDGVNPDPYAGLSGELDAVNKCLGKLPEIAKRDLGVR